MSARLKKEVKQRRDPQAVMREALNTFFAALDKHIQEIADEALCAQEDLRSYSIETVKERLDASEYVVRKMIANGSLETVKPTEGTVRITARSLREFLYGTQKDSKK